MFLTSIVILALISVILLMRPPKKYRNLGKRYHCPSIVPYFGNIYHFLGDKGILPIVESWLTITGENIFIFLSNKPYIIVNNPKLVEFLLASKKMTAKPVEYKYLSDVFGSGLISSEGETWRNHRKILMPTFQRDSLKEFIKIFDYHTKTLIVNLENDLGEDSVDISESISLCSLDIISEAVLGIKIDAQDDPTSEFVSSIYLLAGILYHKYFTSYRLGWLYYVSSNFQDEKRVTNVIRSFSESVIKSRKGGKRMKKKYSFLDYLMNATIDGDSLPESDIRDELNTIIFAGHSTTTSALCFTLYLLSKHQSVQDKVVAELLTIFGMKVTAPTTFEKLTKMKYLEQVIKESLRLYPPISVYSRFIDEDIEFDDILIPKGVSTVFLPYVIHRDPIIYPEPKEFDPERFSEENVKNRHPYAYIPFSAGPRNCIGHNFAILELKSIISKLILHYVILPAIPDHDVEPMIKLTLQSANGIRIRLKRRKLK